MVRANVDEGWEKRMRDERDERDEREEREKRDMNESRGPNFFLYVSAPPSSCLPTSHCLN